MSVVDGSEILTSEKLIFPATIPSGISTSF